MSKGLNDAKKMAEDLFRLALEIEEREVRIRELRIEGVVIKHDSFDLSIGLRVLKDERNALLEQFRDYIQPKNERPFAERKNATD